LIFDFKFLLERRVKIAEYEALIMKTQDEKEINKLNVRF
jgi:hypothetical protein